MKTDSTTIFIITIFIFIAHLNFAQNLNNEKIKTIYFGFNYGYGGQQNFPLSNANYDYNTRFYKLQFNYPLKFKNGWKFALNIEPASYVSEFIPMAYLLNTETDGSQKVFDLENKKLINEYVLNIGLQAEVTVFKNFSTYLLSSIGPMFIDNDTKRLKKGFAFSDILSLGFNYKIKNGRVDLRVSLRHISNAGLSSPNKGYNSSNIEIGFTIPLNSTIKRGLTNSFVAL